MDAAHITYWHWWILAVALLILEVATPGFFLLWVGIAAALTGVLLWLVPSLGWEYQILVFAVLSVATIVLWRMYQKAHPPTSDPPVLNRRCGQSSG